MRKKFLEYYKASGIRKPESIIGNTPIIDASTFFLPMGSLLHLNTFSDMLSGPTVNDNIFSVEQKVYVNNILFYNNNTIGSFRKQSGIQPATIAKELKKQAGSSDIKFPNTKYTAENFNLLVFNYDAMAETYKYNTHPLSLYYRWRNTLETVINTVVELQEKNVDRKHFIMLEVPSIIPALSVLKEYSKKEMSKNVLSIFDTYKLLNLLELWKFLTISTYKDSIFSKLDFKKLDNVILLFKFKNKYVNFRMSDLFQLANFYKVVNLNENGKLRDPKDPLYIPEYKDSSMPKGQFRLAKIMLLLLFRKMINNTAISYAAAENEIGDISNFKNTDGKYNFSAMDIINKSMNDEKYEISDTDIEAILEDYTVANGKELSDLEEKKIVSEDLESEPLEHIFETDKYDELEEHLPANYFMEEEEEIEDTSVVNTNDDLEIEPVQSLEEAMAIDLDLTRDSMLRKIDIAKTGGYISNNLGDQLNELIANQEFSPSPFGDNKLLRDYTILHSEEIKIDKAEFDIPLDILPKGMEANPLKAIDEIYVEKIHKKFIAQSVYKLQNVGLMVTKFNVLEDSTTLGDFQTLNIETTTLQGKKNTNPLYIPTLKKDGSFAMSGIDYRLRKQGGDKNFKSIRLI